MNFNNLISSTMNATSLLRNKSPLIFVISGISGMIATTIMACKETPEAIKAIEEVKKKTTKEDSKVKIVTKKAIAAAPIYAPSILLGTTSIIFIAQSYRINTQRLATYMAAYSIADQKLKTYQRKVIEAVGEEKERQIRKEVNKDVKNSYKDDPDMTYTNYYDKTYLFKDTLTGTIFRSSRDELLKIESKFNGEIDSVSCLTVNDFFYELDSPVYHPESGDDYGWCEGERLDFDFDDIGKTPSGEPCFLLRLGAHQLRHN